MRGTLCNLWGLLPTRLADCRRGSSLREVLGCRLPEIAALRPPCQYASKMSMPRNRSLLLQNRKKGPHQPTRSASLSQRSKSRHTPKKVAFLGHTVPIADLQPKPLAGLMITQATRSNKRSAE